MKRLTITVLTAAAAMSLAACSEKAQNESAEAANAVAADTSATTRNAVNDVDAAISTVRGVQADVGVRHAAALSAQDSLKSATVSLENRRAGIEDKDLAKAVLDLQVQQTNYQAALAVTAKVLQPTLMDYLR